MTLVAVRHRGAERIRVEDIDDIGFMPHRSDAVVELFDVELGQFR